MEYFLIEFWNAPDQELPKGIAIVTEQDAVKRVAARIKRKHPTGHLIICASKHEVGEIFPLDDEKDYVYNYIR